MTEPLAKVVDLASSGCHEPLDVDKRHIRVKNTSNAANSQMQLVNI